MSSLSGIENWTQGTSTLTLKYLGNLSDFSSLSYCTNLANLTIYETELSDISFISSLTNIEVLNLNDNSIKDLKPLETLTNLTTLNLQNNAIYDTSSYKDVNGDTVYYKNLDIIAGLYKHSLTTVYLSGNGTITNWSPVSSISGWDSSSYSGW